jgi:acyl carrier protein
VLDIIADIAPDEDLSNVKPDVRLRDQLQLDSMDFLDIVMELRKRTASRCPRPITASWPRSTVAPNI